MNLNASELATIDFYQWEYLGRGYYHFATPVDIVPPYIPFKRKIHNDTTSIDDGRVPSLLTSLVNLFNSPPEEKPTEELTIKPTYLLVEEVPELTGFSLSFSNNYEVLQSVVSQFLNTLSFSYHPISFEILATFENIEIQIVCSSEDLLSLEVQLKAYFPNIMVTVIDPTEALFSISTDVAIADFGLNEEYMRPIMSVENFKIDPLTSVIATLEMLKEGETALIQTIFKGVSAPWSHDIISSVSDGKGGSFFVDSPEMLNCAKQKVSQPLFSVIHRVAVQGENDQRSKYLSTILAQNITSSTSSEYNKLIPLSNEGYKYDFHLYNVMHRSSNRFGFLLNTKELTTLVHYPNNSVVSEFLHTETRITRAVKKLYRNQKYILGSNTHKGVTHSVSVSDENKVRHTHITGVTGVGKSTLIANMIIDDINHGNGVFLFDPFGDITEHIIERVPSHRKEDVVLIDPSDTDFPIGFNLLHAPTELEKMVLSSDLVSAFKQHATAWGDNMTSVLSYAINTFLDSSQGGTLIELKRFLLEDKFRKQFLRSVAAPSIHYYWNNEYTQVKKRITPLLTRIDTFLRPTIIRHMLAQKSGIDFKECIEQKKIVLIKLPLGLIGEENSYLLASLFISKINQVALARQSLSEEQRHPFYVYIDEFQYYITPSISSILSGARKYGLGLIISHQDLGQIKDSSILNSVLSNPTIRICFRLGDTDAKKLADGFAHFDSQDLQSLNIGQAIMRVGSSNNDWNLDTKLLSEVDIHEAQEQRSEIVKNSRRKYATPKTEVQEILKNLLPKAPENIQQEIEVIPVAPSESIEISKPTPKSLSALDEQKESYLKETEEVQTQRTHVRLQLLIKNLALQQGYKVSIEEPTKKGGRVDVALLKGSQRIGVEVAITNSINYEVGNINKCFEDGYINVIVVSQSKIHLSNIKKKTKETLAKDLFVKVTFLLEHELADYFAQSSTKNTKKDTSKKVRGYRIKTNHVDINTSQKDEKKRSLNEILSQSIKKTRKPKE